MSIMLVAAACGSDDADLTLIGEAGTADGDPCAVLTLDNGFVRLPPAENTAAYVDIANGSDVEVTLVSATTDLGQMIELHETSMNAEGVMSMSEVPGGIVVPAGGSVSLEPGGKHVMIMGVTRAVEEGELIDVGFEFSNGCSTTLSLPVQVVEGMTTGGDDMDDMDGDGMGDTDDMDGDGMGDDS